MRYLNILLGLTMLGFAAVQYNDPDAPLWIFIYMVPCVWAFAAAFSLPTLRTPAGTRWLLVSIAVGAFAVIYYWPEAPGFWRREVWRNDEEAREGMGVMIAFGVLLVALYTALRRPARAAAADDAPELRARTPGS